ncbi:PREDICTED: growth-regulating factor 7-like [Camelina sativa]|uniref:Growth-regulating factor n=1 Tax=Camelina sativa TaxID=90675 RepID=A0ABM0X9R4_CAMSA|nr:PREDICTED: growth-regulating factor 7-like [Camelina sativa]
MDFLKVSDKTTVPCRSDSMFGLNQQQYMEIHPHPHPHHAITPYSGNGVLGCYYYYPFTNAQLKELERQAMIYKYMIASIPVPFDLLVSSSSSASPCINKNIVGDLEPGRCRRTDGKKWRCAKEVVSNHKYCERHLHRGRPRSRKHVEPPYSRPNNNGGSVKNRDLKTLPQKLSSSSVKDKILEPVEVSSSLSNYIESRGSEMFRVSATTEQENKYLNFIDVWSDGVRSSEKQSTTTSTPTPVASSNGNLSLYSLDLSMGGNNLMGQDEMGLIQMGLGVIGSGREDHHGYGPYGVSASLEEMSSWLAPMSTTPGGPLAEILRPSPHLAISGDIESYSLTATPSSSPSRVVKKMMTSSVSDESSQI